MRCLKSWKSSLAPVFAYIPSTGLAGSTWTPRAQGTSHLRNVQPPDLRMCASDKWGQAPLQLHRVLTISASVQDALTTLLLHAHPRAVKNADTKTRAPAIQALSRRVLTHTEAQHGTEHTGIPQTQKQPHSMSSKQSAK